MAYLERLADSAYGQMPPRVEKDIIHPATAPSHGQQSQHARFLRKTSRTLDRENVNEPHRMSLRMIYGPPHSDGRMRPGSAPAPRRHSPARTSPTRTRQRDAVDHWDDVGCDTIAEGMVAMAHPSRMLEALRDQGILNARSKLYAACDHPQISQICLSCVTHPLRYAEHLSCAVQDAGMRDLRRTSPEHESAGFFKTVSEECARTAGSLGTDGFLHRQRHISHSTLF